jgi:hypothetical protein
MRIIVTLSSTDQKTVIETIRHISYNRFDVMYKYSSRGLPVPAPVPASTDKKPSSRIDHLSGNISETGQYPIPQVLDSHIWEIIPPWWPGMILNCIRPLASPSPASAAFHNRMLSAHALKKEVSVNHLCVGWGYRYDEAWSKYGLSSPAPPLFTYQAM